MIRESGDGRTDKFIHRAERPDADGLLNGSFLIGRSVIVILGLFRTVSPQAARALGESITMIASWRLLVCRDTVAD